MKQLLFLAFLMFGGLSMNATAMECVNEVSITDGKTVELQVINVPVGTKLHEGTNRNGNPKYWFELTVGNQKVEVTVSAPNAEKYRKGEVALQVVKKQNVETGKIYYSTRQQKQSKPSVDINLNEAKF